MDIENYSPKIGDILLLNLDPVLGHEQGGERRVIILSNDRYNKNVQLALIAPITTKVKNLPYEVKIPSGYKSRGVILADQVRNISWKFRDFKYIETLNKNVVIEVIRKMNLLFR